MTKQLDIKTVASPGDTVFFMHNDMVTTGTIEYIDISITKNSSDRTTPKLLITYNVSLATERCGVTHVKYRVFPTKEALLASL